MQHLAGVSADCGILGEAMSPYSVSLAEYVRILALTILLETPFYFGFLRQYISPVTILRASLLVNGLTHPAVVFLWPGIAVRFGWSFGVYILVAELFAFVAEAIALRVVWKIPTRRAVLSALIVNLTSWTLGAYLLAR